MPTRIFHPNHGYLSVETAKEVKELLDTGGQVVIGKVSEFERKRREAEGREYPVHLAPVDLQVREAELAEKESRLLNLEKQLREREKQLLEREAELGQVKLHKQKDGRPAPKENADDLI